MYLNILSFSVFSPKKSIYFSINKLDSFKEMSGNCSIFSGKREKMVLFFLRYLVPAFSNNTFQTLSLCLAADQAFLCLSLCLSLFSPSLKGRSSKCRQVAAAQMWINRGLVSFKMFSCRRQANKIEIDDFSKDIAFNQ